MKTFARAYFTAFCAIVALCAGCPERDVSAPTSNGCVEFDHVTYRDERQIICRMVWCEKEVMAMGRTTRTGGVSALWCDPVCKSEPADGGVTDDAN